MWELYYVPEGMYSTDDITSLLWQPKLTPNAAHNVAASDTRYATVNGNLSSEMRCIMWFQGPHKKEKL